eukprot:scaffold2068_cov96-Cylindrotheca_fusiformis.AAC.3
MKFLLLWIYCHSLASVSPFLNRTIDRILVPTHGTNDVVFLNSLTMSPNVVSSTKNRIGYDYVSNTTQPVTPCTSYP